METQERYLSDEQILMRDTWNFDPDQRITPEILERADQVGLRTFGVPERFGGIALEKNTQSQTFAIIATELAPGESAPEHLQEKWFTRYMNEPQFLMAHCLTEPRGASDRWLPYNVPEANKDTIALGRGLVA